MKDKADRTKKRKEVLEYGLGVVAVVFIWKGVWELSAEIISPWISLLIGLAIVGVMAYVRWDFVERLF